MTFEPILLSTNCLNQDLSFYPQNPQQWTMLNNSAFECVFPTLHETANRALFSNLNNCLSSVSCMVNKFYFLNLKC